MRDLITVQGVVISATPAGEYDKRLVLLTRERGKIVVFAKGARRQNSPFMAAANALVFGRFTLYEGRNSYHLNQAEITHHFVGLAAMQPGIYYAYYFLEIADYFGQEGTDEKEMMNLLYLTAKALMNPALDDRLIRCIYELRTMTIQGMMPQLRSCQACGREVPLEKECWFSQEAHGILCQDCQKTQLDSHRLSSATRYAMAYIEACPLQQIYTFRVEEATMQELEQLIHRYLKKNTDRRFRSLSILEMMI